MNKEIFKTWMALQYQLFEFEGADAIDEHADIFLNVTLKVPVGEYPIGKKFTHARLDTNLAEVTFFEKIDDEDGPTYKLNLSIGEKIK